MGAVRRLWMLGIAMGVTLMFDGGMVAEQAFAVGDTNEAACPVATESSPGFRSSLPDCRAYEIVSESSSGDTLNLIGSYGFAEGIHVYYSSLLPTPDEGSRDGLHERFLATRTSSGWVQQRISPPQGEALPQLSGGLKTNVEGVSFTGDFSEAFLMSPFRDPLEDPRLNKTLGVGVYRLSIGSGGVSFQSLPDSGELTQEMIETPQYLGLAETNGLGAFLAGGSADGGRAFFVTTASLATTPGTPADTHETSNEIFERMGGHTYLVGVLPDGSAPACGAEVGQGMPSTLVGVGGGFYSYGAVAPSGDNVVFATPGPQASLPEGRSCNEAGLFLRDVVDGTTVPLAGSLFGGRADTGGGEEEIFTLGAETGDIYEYAVGTGRTTEIGAGSASALLAYSPDGSRVYFLGAEGGIYVYHEGKTKLIQGTLGGSYNAGPAQNTGGRIAIDASTDYGQTRNMPVASGGRSHGSHLLFIDPAKLTGYNNKGHQEAYVYDAETEEVTCISCNQLNLDPETKQPEPEAQGNAQLITKFMLDTGELPYQSPSPPFISDNGSRAVFETTEALVPQDVNGTADVYEWEREDTPGCSPESLRVKSLIESSAFSTVNKGCIYLLSSGLGEEVPNKEGITNGTHLAGASENLDDIYIQTGESLLPSLDNTSKLYDVRIYGGFPYMPPRHGCEAAGCELMTGEAAAGGESTTEAFMGPGDQKSGDAGTGSKNASARKRKLARALRACRKHRSRHRRTTCERAARRKYGFGDMTGRRQHGRAGGSK